MEREDIKMLVAKWWDIYNDESLDWKSENPVSVPESDLNNVFKAINYGFINA